MTYWSDLASLCAIGSMLALSAYLPLTAGAVVLCMGSAMGVGAVVTGWVGHGSDDALSIIVSIGAGAIASSLVMGAVGILTLGLRGFHFSLATLAIAEIARITAETQPALGGAVGYRLPLAVLPLAWPIGISLLVLFVVIQFDRTLLKKSVLLGSQAPERASALGVDLPYLRAGLMAFGGLIAGAAGGLFIYEIGLLDPKWWGFDAGLQVAAFAILGGSRRCLAAATAGIALTLAPELLRFSSDQRMLLFGSILVVAMILRPEGHWRLPTLFKLRRTRLPDTP